MVRKLALHWQILIAIVLAAIVGSIVKQYTTDAFTPGFLGVSYVSIFKFVGAIFLNALKMIIVPLITSSIIVGVAGIGSGGNIGALGWRTLLFYVATTLAAILIGLVVINAVAPGYVDGQPAGDILALDAPPEDITDKIEGKGAGDVAQVFKRMVPPNIVKAAAEGQMLGLIFFSILFGYFMTHLQHEYAEPLFKFWNGVFHVMMKMTELIMKFAPIGVFGLISAVIAETGFAAARPLAIFALAVVAALLLHSVITLPLLLRFIGRVKPFATMRAMSPALLTAFSTSSSSATLPVTMDTLEEKVGVSNDVSSFVLPLGATVNMNGTALYECAAAMFLVPARRLELKTLPQHIHRVRYRLCLLLRLAATQSSTHHWIRRPFLRAYPS